jgi:hypothetical protein
MGFGLTLAGGRSLGAFHSGVCALPLESDADHLDYGACWQDGADNPVLDKFLDVARDLAAVEAAERFGG